MNLNDLAPDDRNAYLYSIGAACQLCQVTPPQLFLVMKEMGVKFQQVVDDVGYINGADLLVVARKCGEIRDEIAAAAGKTEAARLNRN
jgi:hypothetical protein